MSQILSKFVFRIYSLKYWGVGVLRSPKEQHWHAAGRLGETELHSSEACFSCCFTAPDVGTTKDAFPSLPWLWQLCCQCSSCRWGCVLSWLGMAEQGWCWDIKISVCWQPLNPSPCRLPHAVNQLLFLLGSWHLVHL